MTGNRKQLPRNVKVLGGASLLNDIASEMVFPLLPQFLITVLGGNRFHLGIIEGLADSLASLLKLASGKWSDRMKHRKGLVLFGYSLAAVSRPLLSLATAPVHLFAVRISDRVGKGVRTSPRDALIAESTPEEMRGTAFGFHRGMDHLGAAIGPVLATVFLWLRPEGLRELFALTLFPGLAVLALLLFGLREPETTLRRHEPHDRLPPNRNFRLYLVALVVFTLGNSSDAFLLVRAGELGVPTFMLPMLWFVFHIAKSGGNLLAGRWVDQAGGKRPMFTGWFVYGVVYLAFAFAATAWHVWLLFLLYAAYYALTEPAEKTLVAQLSGGERKGTAYGWYNFAIGIAALPASLIFGYFYQQFGSLVAFGWGAGLAALAAVILSAVQLPRASQ